MYDLMEARGASASSLILYATRTLLDKYGVSAELRITGGAKGSGGVRTYALTAASPGMTEEQRTIIEMVLRDVSYDFAVRQKWIIHTELTEDDSVQETVQIATAWQPTRRETV